MFQSIKSDPVKECPSCGRFSVERIIGTGGAIIFKGSGFYQTDYRERRI
ncbi:FmdB family zinc ribbon protein [Candidatus Kuenenia stuttgartensis]